MKNQLSLLLILFLIGCAHTPEKRAYNTVASITATTNAAIQAYGDYLTTHTITESERQIALQALMTYNDSIIAAQQITTQFKVGNSSQSQVDLAISIASNASAALLQIIKPYILKS